MIVTEELRRTFFGAELVYKMFSNAQRQIRTREDTVDVPSFQREHSRVPNTEPEATVPSTNTDEGSGLTSFDFLSVMWDPFTQMGWLDGCLDQE
jgi:hypothetical protein